MPKQKMKPKPAKPKSVMSKTKSKPDLVEYEKFPGMRQPTFVQRDRFTGLNLPIFI